MTTTKEIKREGFTEGEVREALNETLGWKREGCDPLHKLEWAASRYLEAQKPAQANDIPHDAFTKPGAVIRVDADTTAELVRQLAKAREVLAWYADEANHISHDHTLATKVESDRGQRTRDFLGVGE